MARSGRPHRFFRWTALAGMPRVRHDRVRWTGEVIPPAAPISEHSTIATRIRAGDDSRGKAPGVRGHDGLWRGIQFVAMEAMEQDLDVWNAWGASAGVKTGDGLIAVDIDTTNTEAAQKIYELAAKTLGPAAVRFGQKPKCLMLYEAPKDITYKQVQFSTATEDKALIEVLAEGRQFVARGVHPKTGKGYVWPRGIPRREALTRVTAEQVSEAFGHSRVRNVDHHHVHARHCTCLCNAIAHGASADDAYGLNAHWEILVYG